MANETRIIEGEDITELDAVMPDASPFPTHSDMDLDLWQAMPGTLGRRRIMSGRSLVADIYSSPTRDATARRIEMLGELYETLRRATERMVEAGLPTADEHRVLADFVTPKPFPEE